MNKVISTMVGCIMCAVIIMLALLAGFSAYNGENHAAAVSTAFAVLFTGITAQSYKYRKVAVLARYALPLAFVALALVDWFDGRWVLTIGWMIVAAIDVAKMRGVQFGRLFGW